MVRFSEIAYQRPDMDALKDAAEKATRKVCDAKSYTEAREAYFSLQEMEKAADTMYTVCHIRNTINTADPFYDSEMKWLREALAQTIPSLWPGRRRWRNPRSAGNSKRHSDRSCSGRLTPSC